MAGWLIVVLAIPEVVRARRQQAVDGARAVEEERQRRAGEQRLGLAQELHDVLAHNISLINVQASVALHLLDERPEQARPALTAIKDASHEALHELRTALDVLRHGDGAAPLGPAPTLGGPARAGRRLAGRRPRRAAGRGRRPSRRSRRRWSWRRTGSCRRRSRTSPGTRPPGRSTVRLGYGDGVRIEVLDDGVGGAAAPGNGIRGMQERAAALGGQVDVGPRPGGGFRVVAHLPAGAT